MKRAATLPKLAATQLELAHVGVSLRLTAKRNDGSSFAIGEMRSVIQIEEICKSAALAELRSYQQRVHIKGM